ncbi:hypothetical protein [Roseovarius atlanticus]|uniref:hypothetical protein n=1 Tax=Roseovarius atlanticus TaxID=1641875 RepID=UPI001C97C728|nr:hypothetical protein [Roseovarius atlanticus]MBY6127066.1 hypothetical protein [Roseovarius atlanticus]MBY6151560.1 hypothetical protein [Roseovarius atlanticus]
MSHQADRIVFTGDFLRPSVAGLRPTQHENIDWLAKLLRTPVEMASGLPCETVHWDNAWVNGARIDSATIEAIYSMFWRRPDIHAWSQIFAAETLPAMIEDMFARFFAGSLVIGFELPPYLTRFCARHGIPFIDCSLSPVRFMDDLLFHLSSGSAAITDALRPYGVSEDLIRLAAGVLSSNAAKANPRPPRPESLLLILQTRFDKVVIENGGFASLLDHLDRLRDIAAGYRHVLIKEHPLEPQTEIRDALCRALPDAQISDDNFYRLVSHDNLRGVAALSSSCVAEAGYFGKVGHYLIPDFDPDNLTPGIEAVCVDDVILTPDFWRDMLGAAGCEVSDKDGLRLLSKPNRFRQQLRSAWGYNQIDSDIAVGWAPRAR